LAAEESVDMRGKPHILVGVATDKGSLVPRGWVLEFGWVVSVGLDAVQKGSSLSLP